MNNRKLAVIAGLSYLVIFFAAIFANFFALEAIIKSPLETIQQNGLMVRLGIMAFLVTTVFDVIIAWALYELYKEHKLSLLSTYFRMAHAIIMGAAVFALPLTITMSSDQAILHQVDVFNTLWLIGLFFFGFHLILLGNILKNPKWMTGILMLAGVMYIFDTTAHFMLANYQDNADIFLALVAIPSILGEMSLTIWLLAKGGKQNK